MDTCEIRFEVKYLMDEHKALQVRNYVQSYLELEEGGVGRPNLSYPVHTVYFDSPDLRLYWNAFNNGEHHCELRLRYYTEHHESDAYFEVKHWQEDMVLKRRAAIRRDAIPLILCGQLPEHSWLSSRSASDLVALEKFVELKEYFNAFPRLHTAFLREGYVDMNQSVWVTMDRQIVCELDQSGSPTTQFYHPHGNPEHTVFLKLKYVRRYPLWFQEMVETFNLTECDWSKFVIGVALLGGHQIPFPLRHLPSTNEDSFP